MKVTEQVLDDLSNRIMRVNGMDDTRDSYVMLEDDGDNELFMKFMSDGGVTDGKNGHRFHALLQQAKVPHEFFDSRKFFIDADALDKFLSSKGI